MWEWLQQGKNLQGLGTLIGAGGSIYGGITQAQNANKMIDLSNKEYDFNKSLALEDEAAKRRMRKSFQSVYGNGLIPLEDSRVKGY